MRLRVRVAVSMFVVLLCAASPAFASPIGGSSSIPLGTFEWVYDVMFGTGSTFTLTNESEDSFDDIVVDLYAPEAIDPFQSLSLGSIAGPGIAQSIDDLSFLLVPFDLDRARLTFRLGETILGADLFAAALSGDEGVSLAAVDVFAPDPPTEPVPEPSTLLLLGGGIVAVALRRRRRIESPSSHFRT
jgi:hypothetical protein